MKTLLGLLAPLFMLSSEPSLASDFKLNAQVKNGNSVEFIKFAGGGAFDNYLSMNLPFEPIAVLHKQVEDEMRVKLKNRGEAHITVVTPVEYWQSLRPHGITMTEVNEIAEAMHIQSSRFEVICVGQGNAVIDKQHEQTFFVVVESNDLLKIREAVQSLLIAKGGKPEEFSPAAYYPHITLGFTLRDLHESDGILKGRNSCIGKIQLFE